MANGSTREEVQETSDSDSGSGRGSPTPTSEEPTAHQGGVGEPWAQLRGALRTTLRLSKWALC